MQNLLGDGISGGLISDSFNLDLLLACSLANAACAVINIMTALIFVIISRSHAFLLVVAVRSFLRALMAVVANCHFQHEHSRPTI